MGKNGCPANPPSPPPPGCLYLPTGMVFDFLGRLVVNDQNANLPYTGAVYAYDGVTGRFASTLIPIGTLNSPPAPRGIILYTRPSGGKRAFIASQAPISGTGDGIIQVFDVDPATGAFTFNGVLPSPPVITTGHFHPRGLVIGPDGKLYVSNIDNPPSGTGGHIFRYDADTLTLDGTGIFVDSSSCGCDLNRPEGIVFSPITSTSPVPNLFVASFRANASDTDKILIFAGPNSASPAAGTFIGQIVLDEVGQPRAAGQALLFGPGAGSLCQ